MSGKQILLNAKALLPNEHAVIPQELLHPSLRDNGMEYIRQSRKSEVFATTSSLIISFASAVSSYALLSGFHLIKPSHNPTLPILLNTLAYDILIQGVIYPMVAWHGYKNLINSLEDKLKELELKPKDFKPSLKCLLGWSYWPSTASRLATHRVGTLITSLMENNESPFEHFDARNMISKYNVGMFDGKMNMVLIKHPDSKWNNEESTGIKGLVRRIAHHQPFHRPRFDINPPQAKDKRTAPANAAGAAL